MRKSDATRHAMFSYRMQEERIPDQHPLCKLRVLVDGILPGLSADFKVVFANFLAKTRMRPGSASPNSLRRDFHSV